MNESLIGRVVEQQILQEALDSDKAELVSVIGRRRIGKTFLIESYYREQIVFQITGIQEAILSIQLRNFAAQLTKFIKKDTDLPVPIQVPKDWFDAFLLLIDYLENKKSEQKIVVFFDELPWLATHKSGFLAAFGYFWISWAVRKNIVVVICGSAASWMIRKVVHHRGGLHNRVTKQIALAPFTLAETEQYLLSKKIQLERYHILQLYMVMGGVPHYLEGLKPGLSATQNINQLAFSATGLLRDEFSKLYHSLFNHADRHIQVIRTLANRRQGLTRTEIVEQANFSDGGTIQKVLEELLRSGFLSTYQAFGKKKKEKRYYLTDEYSFFYLKFIEGKEQEGEDIWHHISQTQAYKSWSGYAFEHICIKHLFAVKKALGISGIYAESSSFYKKGTVEEAGVQIDLLLDRKDQAINLFEIKFYSDTYTITKDYAATLRNKMSIFQAATKTRKQLFWVFITTFGLKQNAHSLNISKSFTMDDLFV